MTAWKSVVGPRRHRAQRRLHRAGRERKRTRPRPGPRDPGAQAARGREPRLRQEQRGPGGGRTRPRDRDAHDRHRSAAGADARPDRRGTARMRGSARPRPQQRAAASDAAHQRVRGAHGLPTPPSGERTDGHERLLAGDLPEGATTSDRIPNAAVPADRRPVAGACSRGSTERAPGQRAGRSTGSAADPRGARPVRRVPRQTSAAPGFRAPCTIGRFASTTDHRRRRCPRHSAAG